ncbi:sterol desaturase family protein [Litorimonas sp. WD9-15]|uniref:sterol desaturase family protein n=1 Tax=Litorimonas sp. WD9-15 TaxID=3418716 RepID=UPI003D0345C2
MREEAGLDVTAQILQDIYNSAFGLSSRLNPLYCLAMLPIAAFIYRRQKIDQPFFGWLIPRKIYTHASTVTDLKLFVIGRALALTGLLNATFIKILVVYLITQNLGWSDTGSDLTVLDTVLLALVFTIVADFCTYWIHRVHHEVKVIWPFHAVHHSAEVMTPLTVYRKHPIYDLISAMVKAVVTGLVQGLILALLFGQLSLATIGGVTVFFMLFNMVGANFRHSHIWISYGPFWSRIFISPAQHQVHHSLAHKHWHKNYGEIFAVWDWMFDTLYVPEDKEFMAFGLSTPDGARIEQPYPTALAALINPFQEAADQFNRSEKSIEIKVK